MLQQRHHQMFREDLFAFHQFGLQKSYFQDALDLCRHLEFTHEQVFSRRVSAIPRDRPFEAFFQVAQRLEAIEPDGVASRFIYGHQPSLEAQLCNLADEIAYNAHDIDDGVRSGLISLDQLREVPLFVRYIDEAAREHPQLANAPTVRRWLYEAIRRMLTAQVYDVLDATRKALADNAPDSAPAVRGMPVMVTFSAEMRAQSSALKSFLFRQLYRHPKVMETTQHAKQIVGDLFSWYLGDPVQMQAGFYARSREAAFSADSAQQDALRARVVADYIAGMTDRFALREHTRLTGRPAVLLP